MEQVLDEVKELRDFLHDDQQDDDKTRKRRHRRLLLPAGADEDLIQYGHNNTDGCNLEYQIYFHFTELI